MKREELQIGKVYKHRMEIYKVSKNKVVVNFYYERLKLVKIEEDTDGWYGVFETKGGKKKQLAQWAVEENIKEI